jgi:hypothetical protein
VGLGTGATPSLTVKGPQSPGSDADCLEVLEECSLQVVLGE